MKLKLPDNIHSTQDINQLLLELHEYMAWHGQSNVRKQVEVELAEPPAISALTQDVLEGWHGKKSMSAKTIEKLIFALEDLKEDAPRVSITLAAPPGRKLKTQLARWCRSNLDERALIEFGFDKSLLGGMVVRYKSHIYDWSFRRKIVENRYEFIKALRNV